MRIAYYLLECDIDLDEIKIQKLRQQINDIQNKPNKARKKRG